MKAIHLTGYKGFESMQLFEVEKPKPGKRSVARSQSCWS